MNPLSAIRALFYVAAAYDGLLGLAFLVAGPAVFDLVGITPPNHWGYIHFPAGLLVVFGLMFVRIAMDPVANRGLIVYGILLKVCYVGTVGWHWIAAGIPAMWLYFAVADACFAVLFAWSLVRVRAAPVSA